MREKIMDKKIVKQIFKKQKEGKTRKTTKKHTYNIDYSRKIG
jgi:hypothetical protein